MELFLLRHGDAEIGLPDSARCLSSLGEQQVAKMANSYGQKMADIELVLSSPLQRAIQSTKILLSHAKLNCNIQVVDFLLPTTSVAEVERQCQQLDAQKLLMVGHLPLLDYWINYLTADQSVRMATASLASLSMDYAYKGMATLNWIYHAD